MTDPLEQDVLSFLSGYKPPTVTPTPTPAAPVADPLEDDVLSFLSTYKAPSKAKPAALPAVKPVAPARDPILARMPPALAASFEGRPEFAAQLAKDRAAGISDDEILAKIQVGQQVKPKRPAWATNAPSTAEATNDALYGQPSAMETAVEAGIRGTASAVGNAGALMERFGRKAELPKKDDPNMDPVRAEALAKMRDIYSVGAPGAGASAGASFTPIEEAVVRPVVEAVVEPTIAKGESIQRDAEATQQALPRPKYARDFMEGLKTDPLKTLAISGVESVPQLAVTIGAAMVAPELGLAAAWAQETGGAYQEAKQRGATEEEAQQISGIVGAANMFLEYLPAGKALEALGGATRKGVKGFVYDMLEQAVAEGATESIQEANQMLVTAAVNAKDQGFTFEEFRDRIMEAGLSAMVVGGWTGALAHVGGSAGNVDQRDEAVPQEPQQIPRDAPAVIEQAEAVVTSPEPLATLPPVDLAAAIPPEPLLVEERRAEPQPAGEPRERRIDSPTRKRVAEMTDEEKTAALLTSEVTGLPNRRAWEEQAAEKPVHIAVDADGLKWVNDRFGHDTGSQLLRTLGEAIGPLGAYHLQGDEFAMAADSVDEAQELARRIDENLAGSRLRYTAGDGTTFEIPIGASYGVGETYAEADRRSLEAKAEREARGQRAARGEQPPGLVEIPPAGRQVGNAAEGELNGDVRVERREAGVQADRAVEESGGASDLRLPVLDSIGSRGGRNANLGRQATGALPDDPGAGNLEGSTKSKTATPEPRAQESPSTEASRAATVTRPEALRQAPENEASVAPPEPPAAQSAPEPDSEPDRGPESLPARLMRPRQRAGQEGFAVVPGAIKEPIVKWWRKRMTAQGLAPRYYLDLKVRRDGQLAAKAAHLDAMSIDLARAIRRYKGPLSPTQLKTYLDDAYRGMNVGGLSGGMDDAQVARIKARRNLSEVAAQRLREDSSPRGLKSAPEFLPLLREMRVTQDDLARTLRRQGLLDDASIQDLEREFGLYVHRQYEAPRNPKYKEWIKKQPLWQRAYDLTQSLWDRQAAADRAEDIVDELKLKRPPVSGPFRQGEKVEIAPAEKAKRAPKPEGEEELTRAAKAKVVNQRPDIVDTFVAHGKAKVKALEFADKSGAAQTFEIRTKPGESPSAARARVLAEAEARRDELYPKTDVESLPSGQMGRIVQVKDGKVFVEIRDEDGKRKTLSVPENRVQRAFGTKADAIADVRRALMDPSTRDQFLDDYQLDAETFNEAHDKVKEGHPDMPPDQVWAMLQTYMDATGNQPVLPGGVPEGSKDLSALKRRSRMNDLERLLRGEVKSLDWNFLTTSLKMATIVAQHRFLVDLEAAGRKDGLFVEKPSVKNANAKDEVALTKPIDPDFYTKSIETAKGREPGIDQRVIKQGAKKTAPLSGLYTSEEMMEALHEQFDFKSYPDWLKYYMRATVTAKGAATAGSAVSLSRNVWSQPLVLMANGVNPLNAKRFWKAGMDAYPRAVGNTNRARLARNMRYIELGFVDQGTDIGDIKRMEKRAQVFRDDIPHGAGSTGGRIFRETIRGARNLYQAPDNQGKIQIFEANLPLYIKALPNLTKAQVEEHLAKKMLDSTQNYPMSPPLIKDIASFPYIGDFISFRVEVVRNLYHSMRIAAEEVRDVNPEIRKIGLRRVAGISAAMALPVALAYASRMWLNMDDEDDEATRRFMAPWNKQSTIIHLGGYGTDDIKFIDFSFMDYYSAAKQPFAALLRGDFKGMYNSITDPFGEAIMTKAVIDAWRGQDVEGYDVYNKQDSTLSKAIDITKHVGAPLTPGVIKQVSRLLDPERDKSSEILGFFGVRKTVINIPKELRRRVKSFQDGINDSRWIEKKVIRKAGTEDAFSAAEKRSRLALTHNINELILDINAARQLGQSEGAIEGALVESGVGKATSELLMSGDVAAVVDHYIELNEKWGEERRGEN